jgi:ribose transport system permease protein
MTTTAKTGLAAVDDAGGIGGRPSTGIRVLTLVTRFGMLGVLIGLVIAAQVVYPEFLTWTNLQNTLTQNSPTIIVAFGMTFVLIGGGFDLSVAGSFGLAGVLYAGLVNDGQTVGLSLAVALASGLACGIFNGLVITKLRVNPFVATLGSATIFLGIAAVYAHSEPIAPAPAPGFTTLGQGKLGGVYLSILIMIALYLVGTFVLTRTVFGRSVFATGSNREAARLAGIRVDRIHIATYIICALGAALAGIILTSSLSSAQFDQGTGVDIQSIAAVVIGGTALFGGEGALWRTAVGVAILATINNLFSSLAIESPIQNIIQGAILIVAVAFAGLQHILKR